MERVRQRWHFGFLQHADAANQQQLCGRCAGSVAEYLQQRASGHFHGKALRRWIRDGGHFAIGRRLPVSTVESRREPHQRFRVCERELKLSDRMEAMGVAGNSPLGRLILAILEEGSANTLTEARQLARLQLLKAAGRKYYRVTSPKQDRAAVERFKRRVNPTLETAKTGVSSAFLTGPEALG